MLLGLALYEWPAALLTFTSLGGGGLFLAWLITDMRRREQSCGVWPLRPADFEL